MIILCVIYASLESEKNILHFKLYTERLSREHVCYGTAFRLVDCKCQSDWIIKLNKY